MDHYSRSARNTFAGLVLNRKPLNALDAPAWEQILISGRALYVVVRGDEILFDADRSEPLLLAQRMLGGCDKPTWRPCSWVMTQTAAISQSISTVSQCPRPGA